MTYKAAISGLQLGGGKAVIMGDPNQLKSEAFFRTFGRFVNGLGGRYITAEDVNIGVEDMEYVALETPYVTGLQTHQGSGDPSPITALGVYHGIRASVKHKYGKKSLKGMRVSVQGVGSVGKWLCKYLHDDGVELIVADIKQKACEKISQEYGAKIVDTNEFHAVEADVFAPCALGAILNDETIPQLKTEVVAGGANNQLLDETAHGKALIEKGILYAPDYVINAGGLINVYHELQGYNEQAARIQTAGIYDTLLNIFTLSDEEKIPTITASNRLAEKRINSIRGMKDLRNSLEN
jgi:leucine dehydrogenase